MSERDERVVAQAICRAAGWDPDQIEPADGAGYLIDGVVIPPLIGPRWQRYVPHARAAIAALPEMREKQEAVKQTAKHLVALLPKLPPISRNEIDAILQSILAPRPSRQPD